MRGRAIQGGVVPCSPKPIRHKSGETIGFTLMSDLHIGAQNVDYQKIKSDIDEAIKVKDRILINGDVFDAIIAHDRRFTPDVLHPRLQGKRNTLNAAIEWAVQLLGPAANNIDMIGCGNHEEHVTKYGGIDILQILVHELQKMSRGDHLIHVGGYTGFVDYRFKNSSSPNRRDSQRMLIYYHHGAGGSGGAGGGALALYRKRWVIADVHWLGHIHANTTRTYSTMTMGLSGSIVIRDVKQAITASYMDTYRPQSQKSYKKHGRVSNYAADAGLEAAPKGSTRLLVTPSRHMKIKVLS